MGPAARWLQGLLGVKKTGISELLADHKEKRRWGFGKSLSEAQAAASSSGLGGGFFKPISLYSSTHELFEPLGRGEEDDGGMPQPVLLQASALRLFMSLYHTSDSRSAHDLFFFLRLGFPLLSLQGKGVTASSIGILLKACGLRVTSIKIDVVTCYASGQRWPNCVHILLECGALVCASTGRYGFPGSTPLHFAARERNLDCVRELLARGADSLQRDASGRLPYEVALKQNHGACATLLNPSAAEPLVWPSALKFISELDLATKSLLEATLMESNREREMKILKATTRSLTSPTRSDKAFDDDFSENIPCIPELWTAWERTYYL